MTDETKNNKTKEDDQNDEKHNNDAYRLTTMEVI